MFSMFAPIIAAFMSAGTFYMYASTFIVTLVSIIYCFERAYALVCYILYEACAHIYSRVEFLWLWWRVWGRITLQLVKGVLPWQRITVRRRERRAARSLLVPHTNGPVNEFVTSEALKVRYELRIPNPESRVDRAVLYCKASAMIKDLQTKPIGQDIRAKDIRHLVNLFVLTALTTTQEDVELVDSAVSMDNIDMYSKLGADRYSGWFGGFFSWAGFTKSALDFLNREADHF